MKKILKLMSAILHPAMRWMILGLLIIPLSASSQSAKEMYRQTTVKTTPGNMEMTSTLTIIDARNRQRIRRIVTARKKFRGTEKMILRFLEPTEVKGTTLLVYDHDAKSDEMWVYLPALHKVRRIVSEEKSKSFMGSEFSHADMSKPTLEDFTYALHGTEIINGTVNDVLVLQCRTEAVARELGYRSKQIWIDQQTGLTSMIRFFGPDQQLLKEQLFSDYQKLPDGSFFARSMSMTNLQNKRKSVIQVDAIQPGCQLTEWIFSPDKIDQPL